VDSSGAHSNNLKLILDKKNQKLYTKFGFKKPGFNCQQIPEPNKTHREEHGVRRGVPSPPGDEYFLWSARGQGT